MKYMVYAFVFAGFFIGRQIPGVFHHHNGLVIPAGAAADRTQFLIRQRKAFFAVAYIFFGVHHSLRQPLYLFLRHVDDMKRESLRRFGSYTRKLGQFFN